MSGKSEPRPGTGETGRKRGGPGIPGKNGQRGSAVAISPPRKSGGVLPRVDQEQAGSAAVPRTPPGESSDRTALGLPDLQLATVDSSKQVASVSCRKLNEASNPTGRQPDFSKNLASRTIKSRTDLLALLPSGFFTASALRGVGGFGFSSACPQLSCRV